tara:strand:+ start:2447 stop:3583 length:1137 start_codon:yes stop_codon:yes gene_type:complete
MKQRFYTSRDQGLQNAYGAWARALPTNQIVAIALPDLAHTMAAFFGCAHVGRIACIAACDLDDRFTVLRDILPPRDAVNPLGEAAPFITFTSGSTNKPKAILRDADSWIYSFERNGVHVNDTVAVIGNLAHSLPHYAACEAMHIGAKLVFCPKRLTAEPTVVYATPTQLRMQVTRFESARMVMVGGGHFTAQDRAHATRVFPNADVRVFYGTAETSFVAIADHNTPDGSVGRAYDGVKARVMDGNVSVQTPMMAHRYLDKVKGFEHGVPFETGEQGWIDPKGNLFLNGRADRRVTIADQSIHLDAIEADLMAIPDVTTAGVVALPDDKRGLRAFGAVIGADASHPLLGGVIMLKNWPVLISGKTDYGKLRTLLAEAFL